MFLDSKRGEAGVPDKPNVIQHTVGGYRGKDGKGNVGGNKARRDRIYTLAYADDMVLMAKNEEEMRSLLYRLEDIWQIKNWN